MYTSSFQRNLADKLLLMFVMFSLVSMTTNGVYIHPIKTVSFPGDRFHFICSDSSRNALSVQWLVNGTLLENDTLENVFKHFDNRSKTARLDFNLPLEHNVTTIQCIVNFASKNVSSETITLLLQGLLAAVGSPSVDLVGTDIFLIWTAPFTLDISNVDPDITYCVDVVNSTSSSTVLSECGITVTGFNFSIPIGRVCDNYTFTVTPVNMVGNGTAVTLVCPQDITAPRAKEKLLLPKSESIYLITMSAPVSYGELIIINDNTGDEIHIQRSDLNITMNIIMFTSKNLKKNQLYTVSVNARNMKGSAVSYVSLSTHDVMNATFDVASHTITTEYFEYSTAMGALCIFIFINEDSSIDFKKSIYLPLDRSSSHNYTLPDISPGQYQMFVYDIDSNVTLHDSVSYPANTNMFSIISNDSQASYSQNTSSEFITDCSVTYVDDVISAMCSYSNDSSVTGFEMIVQLNNVDEVHKLYINGTTEYQSPGQVIVRVEENGTYQVAIFPILRDRGIMNTTIAYSQVLSSTEPQTMIPEISEENSLRWIIGVGVPLILTLIAIVSLIVCIKGGSLKSCNSTPQSIHQSIPLHDTSAHSTESENNPGWEELKLGYKIVNPDNSPQQEVDNDVQSIGNNTGLSMEEEDKEVNSQQTLNLITMSSNTEGAVGSNTEGAVGSNTEGAVDSNTVSPVGSNTEDAVDSDSVNPVGSNTDPTDINTLCTTDSTSQSSPLSTISTQCTEFESNHGSEEYKPGGKQALEDIKSYQQHVNNTEHNINCNISQSKNEEVYSQEDLNPKIDGANTESDVWKSNSEVGCANSVDDALAENNLSWSEVQTDRKIVDNSQCGNLNECAAMHEKAVQNQLANKKIAPSSLADGEKLPSSPKGEPTDKEMVPTSHKNRLIYRRAMILLMLVQLFPASIATDGVHLFSHKTVSIPGDECGFHCFDTSLTALSVQWLVNGTPLENSTLVIVFQHYSNISKTADLSLNLHLEDNGTTIQCIINFPTKNVSSETITLLLQGTLPAVGSPSIDLVGTDILLTWTAPFTLDISNVDPDITYCVDVVNSTSSSTILPECGITVTGFNFSIPIGRECDNYTFTVTPVNMVGNGTAVTLVCPQDITVTDATFLISSSQSVAVLTVQVTVIGMLLATVVMVDTVTVNLWR